MILPHSNATGDDTTGLSCEVAAFLFDFDGVLFDTEKCWAMANQAIFAHFGKMISFEEASRFCYGRNGKDVMRDVMRIFAIEERNFDDLVALEQATTERIKLSDDFAIPESIEFFLRMADRVPVAIVSGSREEAIRKAAAMSACGNFLDKAAFIQSTSGLPRGKPDPLCYQLALERLGTPPGATVVVEDSAVGILAAKGARAKVIALARPEAFPQDTTLADWVVPSLDRVDFLEG